MRADAQGSPFFERWAGFVLRRRGLCITLTLGTTLVMALQAADKLRMDTTDENFLSSEELSIGTLQEVRRDFGNDVLLQVLVQGDVFSLPYLERLTALHRQIEQLELPVDPIDPKGLDGRETTHVLAGDHDFQSFGDEPGGQGWEDEEGGTAIDEVLSLINYRQTVWQAGALRIKGLFERLPEADELARIRDRIRACTGLLPAAPSIGERMSGRLDKRRASPHRGTQAAGSSEQAGRLAADRPVRFEDEARCRPADRKLAGRLVDVNGAYSIIVVRMVQLEEQEQGAVVQALATTAQQHDRAGFRVHVTGSPAVRRALHTLMLSDAASMLALTSIAMVLILFVLFRHALGVFAPVLVVWQAEIWTVGLMAATGTPITMVTTILPAFIGCVGLGDTIHVQSAYRAAMGRGIPAHGALVHALSTTGMPVFLTTLTTVVGLLSFRFATLTAIQQMGTFGALGVTAALINSIVFLPAMLSFNRTSTLGYRVDLEGSGWMDRVLQGFNALSAPVPYPGGVSHIRRNSVLVCCVPLGVLAVVGVSRLRIHHDSLDWFPDSHPVRQTLELFERTVGGTGNLTVLVSAKDGETLARREALDALARLEAHVQELDDPGARRGMVRGVTSLLDPIRESFQAVHGGDARYYRVPDSERGVRDMITLFEQASPQTLRQLATIDMTRALLSVRVRWSDALSYLPLLSHVRQGLERHMGGVATARLTGSAYVAVTLVSKLLMDLVRSFGTAAIVITLLMVLLLRDLKIGMLSMLPNLTPVVMVMGYMGFSGIPLDANTLLLGSVAIGIVVDDTIHFLHQFKVRYERTGDVEAALRHAFRHTGRAMLATSLVLSVGFMCVLGSELVSTQRFGMLVALTVVLALVFDLSTIPALLRAIYSRHSTSPCSTNTAR